MSGLVSLRDLPLTSVPTCNLCRTCVSHPASSRLSSFSVQCTASSLLRKQCQLPLPKGTTGWCPTGSTLSSSVLSQPQQLYPKTEKATGVSHKPPNSILVLTAGFGLSSVSWLVFTMTFLFDLSRYSLERTWLWRFPLVLIAAGQVAQLRYHLPLFTYN